MKKKILQILIFIAISFLAALIWYSPITFKGHALTSLGSSYLIKARNLFMTGRYSSENELNVILSPLDVKNQGVTSLVGNSLSPRIYSFLFNFFNFRTNSSVVFANCVLLATALFFFLLSIYYLFDFKTAVIFGLIYIFLPFNWLLPQTLVGYSVAFLLFALFWLFFSIGMNKFSSNKKINFWPKGLLLILSSFFVSASIFSKETLILILPAIFVYFLFKKQFKQLLYFFIPLILLFSLTYLPSILSKKGNYLHHFVKYSQNPCTDFSSFAHLYPDPYTCHFDRKSFLQQRLKQIGNSDIMASLGIRKILQNTGSATIPFFDRFKLGLSLLLRHIFRFASITEIGGVLITILLILGAFKLREKNKNLFNFFVIWISLSILTLSFIVLGNRNHLMDWGVLITLLIVLGILFLVEVLKERIKINKKLISIVLVLLVLYNLLLASHVMWGEKYDKSFIPILNYYARQINNKKISKTLVVAVPFRPEDAYNLNFLTNQSIIVFKEETIKKLLRKSELKIAFEKFNVKYIMGYPKKLSKKINQISDVSIIANSEDVKLEQKYKGINNKNWFLNLIK